MRVWKRRRGEELREAARDERAPDRAAMTASLIFDGRRLTGLALDARGERLAGGLHRLGLREGDVVAILLRNDPVYADVVLACRIAGISYCPLNWHFTPAELDYILSDSGAKAIIGHADLLAAAHEAIPTGLPVLAVGAPLAAAFAYEEWLAGQAPYDGPPATPRGHMAYTSGTTGRPKGVVRFAPPVSEAEAAGRRVRALAELTLGLVPGCRALIPAPLYHSAPSAYLQTSLQVADTVVLHRRFDAEAVLAAIEEHRIDAIYLVPIMYARLLALPEAVRRRHDLSSLRFVASTGSPCAPGVKAAMIDWFGPVLTESYGSSEAGLATIATSADSLAKPGTAGRPAGDAVIRILGEDGREKPTGEAGLVYVRQPAYGDFTYRNRPEAREAIGRDGLVTLGDIGYLDADGYLFLCDRASDLVISGGVNIYPAEIEHALIGLPGVRDCAVFGIPDPEFGERLMAHVEPAPEARLDPAGLRAALGGLIAGYKVPRDIEIVPALPRDETGKIAKRLLRDRYWGNETRRI